MNGLALRGQVRRLFTWLHRWSGLAILIFLTVACLSGSYLAFRSEFDRWLNPGMLIVTEGEFRLPLAAAIAAVERDVPGAQVTSLYLPQRRDAALSIYVRAAGTAATGHGHGSVASPLAVNQVFVDPYTGRLLGGRRTTGNQPSRATLGHVMLRLHYALLASDAGEWVLGVCALVWLLTLPMGAALAWPLKWQLAAGWWRVITVRIGSGAYAVTYDLHRSIGLLTLPLAAMLAFSSVYLNLPGLVKPVVDALSPLTPVPTRSARAWPSDPVDADRALAAAMAVVPGAEAYSVTRDFTRSWYAVRLRAPGDISTFGNNYVYVDAASGAVSATNLAGASTAGDRFILWQFPLHSGLGFGLTGQTVIALTGLLLTLVNLSGLYVWFVNWRLRRRASLRREADTPISDLSPGNSLPLDAGFG